MADPCSMQPWEPRQPLDPRLSVGSSPLSAYPLCPYRTLGVVSLGPNLGETGNLGRSITQTSSVVRHVRPSPPLLLILILKPLDSHWIVYTSLSQESATLSIDHHVVQNSRDCESTDAGSDQIPNFEVLWLKLRYSVVQESRERSGKEDIGHCGQIRGRGMHPVSSSSPLTSPSRQY